MASSTDPRITKIHPIYRIFLLYIEPICAISGAYLAHFNPSKYIFSTSPASISAPFNPLTASTLTPDPVIPVLCTNIAALYVLFAFNEAVVLRLTRDYSVWKAVIFAMILCDIGHLWGVYLADPVGSLRVGEWTGEEWINEGTLLFGLGLRVLFLMGVGNGR